LCSERAAYIYLLDHVVHGVKKVWYKKKFQSSCCFASTFSSNSSLGLILLFSCGKIEIKSQPELSLVKETALKAFMHSPSKPNSFPNSFIWSSVNGQVIMARGDREIVVASVLLQNERYRHLDSFAQVYDKNLITPEDGCSPLHSCTKKRREYLALYSKMRLEVRQTKELIWHYGSLFWEPVSQYNLLNRNF